MTPTGFSLIFLFILGIVAAAAMVGLSALLGQRGGKKTQEYHIPYECGLDPLGDCKPRVSIKFFLVAVQFIIFDIEVVFLYPWAIVFREFVNEGYGLLMFVKMMIFIGVLLFGFVYAWARGALEWEK